jgi:hypothetical protein
VGKRSIATIGREKRQNINMNKKPLLQVDSSEVSGITTQFYSADSYPLDRRCIRWIGLIHRITYPPFVQPVSQEIWPPRKFGPPGPYFLGNMAPSSEIWPPLKKYSLLYLLARKSRSFYYNQISRNFSQHLWLVCVMFLCQNEILH